MDRQRTWTGCADTLFTFFPPLQAEEPSSNVIWDFGERQAKSAWRGYPVSIYREHQKFCGKHVLSELQQASCRENRLSYKTGEHFGRSVQILWHTDSGSVGGLTWREEIFSDSLWLAVLSDWPWKNSGLNRVRKKPGSGKRQNRIEKKVRVFDR